MGYRSSNVRYVVLLGLCLAAGLAYIHRGCLSVLESKIRGDLGINERDMGWAMGLFYWSYALFQIPTGVLVDRWGPRRSLFLFGVLGAITMAMSAGSQWADAAAGFAILTSARLLMGVAQAGLFPASTRALAVWIPPERRAFAAGTLQACMSLGGAVGAFLTAKLMGLVSWSTIFLIYAVPGLIWSLWFFGWYRDQPDEHASVNDAERALLRQPIVAAGEKSGSDWFAVLTSVPVLLLCAQQLFRAASNVFWFSWCPTYLQQVHSLSKERAGELTSLPIIGVMIGSILGGLVADRLYRRTGSRRISRAGTAIVATFLGVILFVATFMIPEGHVALAISVLSLAALVVSGGNSCSYSTAMDLGGRNLATIFGAMNMFGNIGAAIFSHLGPEWVKWFSWEALVLLVGGAYLLGMLCWLPLNPDREIRARSAF